MKTFLRVVDRFLIHLYLLAGLGMTALFMLNQMQFDQAEFDLLQVQTQALIVITRQLHGFST